MNRRTFLTTTASTLAASGTLSAAERERAFNEAIKKSLAQEQDDAKTKP